MQLKWVIFWVSCWVFSWLLAAIVNAHTLSWQDNSANEDGFILEACPNVCTNTSGAWNEVSRFPSNTTKVTFTLASLTSYRIKAYNIAGISGPSNVVTIPDSPKDPAIFTVGP